MDSKLVKAWLNEAGKIMCENKEYLIELDQVVGDGDLGLTMSDGFVAAYESIKETKENDIGTILYFAGRKMSTAVPSTMGTLMASGLMQAGKKLKGQQTMNPIQYVELFEAYEQGVMSRGKAKIGDKTFLDGLNPGIIAMRQAIEDDMSLKDAAHLAYEASKQGYANTATMLAVHGRAATRGEASRSLKDPGAYVAVLLMKAFEMSVQGV